MTSGDDMKAGEFTMILASLVVLFLVGVVLGVVFSIPPTEDGNEAVFSIHNATGGDVNATVFVLNGEDWDEIAVDISNNTTIPLAITWHGEGGVNVHIVYRDWDSNERVLRYYARDGEYQVTVLY